HEADSNHVSRSDTGDGESAEHEHAAKIKYGAGEHRDGVFLLGPNPHIVQQGEAIPAKGAEGKADQKRCYDHANREIERIKLKTPLRGHFERVEPGAE